MNKKTDVKTEDIQIDSRAIDMEGLEIKDEMLNEEVVADKKDNKKTALVLQPMNTKKYGMIITKKRKCEKSGSRSTTTKQINNHRLASALSQANTATSMTRAERLEKYSFINKYKGRWNI